MKYSSVAHILPSAQVQMGNISIKQPLPTQRVPQISPFLLLHHFGPLQAQPGEDPLDIGPHPHRGFEPVTFLYSGGIRHKDSRGNEGILAGGDIQWMTAGRGIIHSERASREFLENGGVMEGIQLWINLPKRYKMEEPRYQDIKADQLPVLSESHSLAQTKVVAGTYRGIRGPARTFTPLLILQIDLAQGGEVEVEIPAGFNACVYLVRGGAQLNRNFDYPVGTLLYFRNDGEGFSLTGLEPTQALVMAGEPIDEPLAQWGPYVMNEQSELLEAMRDYQMGKMGFYID
ncbi:MAG: pirin family protein [Haliscomenobacter sp.]|nr:pirin family protein [Haliscomenobacter sp.]MBK8877815.1 pirin family protein [Haliscomenobacter sp.]